MKNTSPINIFKSIKRYLLSGGTFLIAAQLLANILNFGFNAYLGRSLSFEDFGLVTLVTSLWNLLMIPLGSLSSSINHRSAFLISRVNRAAGLDFYRATSERSLIIAAVLSVLWIAGAYFIADFFNIPNILVVYIMTPIIAFGTISFTSRGYLAGTLSFGKVGMLVLMDSAVKLAAAIMLVVIGLGAFTYFAIPTAVTLTGLVAVFLVHRVSKTVIPEGRDHKFPRRFFTASILGGLAITAFLSLDVILVKHYLDPVTAGQYAFLSLVGKMVFFFGTLFNSFVITFVSRDEGAGRDPRKRFYKILFANYLLTMFAFFGVGVIGPVTVPLLFGAKAAAVIPYLFDYSLAIALYTISSCLVLYHLARQQYLFSALAIVMSGVLTAGIIGFHDSIRDVTTVLLNVSITNFIITGILHILQRNGRFIFQNLVDIFEAFAPLPSYPSDTGHKRILIYNWRDLKHSFAGGAEVYIDELAKRWVQKGYSVTVFCGNDGKSPRNEVKDGVRIIRRGGFYFVYAWGFLYYITQFRGRYDVIIDCQNGIPFFTPLYVREPVYCVMHHVHQEVFRKHLSKPLAAFARILENRLMPWAYRNTPFITVSESTKTAMQNLDLVGSGIGIVHNGVNLDVLKPGKKSTRPMILYLGRLKYYKTINIFIRAAKIVLDKGLEAEFVVAGEGEERKGLADLAHRLGIGDKITFAGKVADDEKAQLYKRAWVMVNPSAMEGWGITSIEANACGTPVVASDVPGLRDSVRDGISGLLVPHGDDQAFADAIYSVITDYTLRKKLSAGARKWAQRFDWQSSADEFLEILNGKRTIERSKRLRTKPVLTYVPQNI